MRFKTRRLLAVASAIALLTSFGIGRSAQAQVQDSYAFVRADWHLAGVSEYVADWNGAINYYRKAIEHSDVLPLSVREWYRGTAQYGIARCAARMKKDSLARAALAVAYRHHFWNSALIRLDSELVASCGSHWFDSISAFWAGVRTEDDQTWRPQPTFTYYPSGYDSTDHWPLIVAMHGGNANYESFAQRWQEMANLVRAVIVVPPGVIRESEITNSWGSDMNVIETPIIAEVKKVLSAHHADPNQVYLTGFSQGGQATIELSIRHPDIFRGGIAMSGFASDVPTDSALAVAHQKGTRLFAITGEYEDAGFHAQIVRIHDLCAKANVPFELTAVPGMIHEVPLDLRTRFLEAWNWLRSTPSGDQASAQRNRR